MLLSGLVRWLVGEGEVWEVEEVEWEGPGGEEVVVGEWIPQLARMNRIIDSLCNM